MRKKQRMKSESPALAWQRQQHITRWKREQMQTLNFLSVFSCSSKCLFASFVFTGSRLVWYPFSEAIPKWGCIFRPSSYCPLLELIRVFALLCLWADKFSNTSFCLVSWGRTYPFRVFLHLRRGFGTSWVFLVIFRTIIIHQWKADQQWVLWHESFRGQLAVFADSLSAFSFLFFLLFRPSPEFLFIIT